MKTRSLAALVALACLTACSDGSTDPESGLSPSEASALAGAILDLSLDAGLSESGSAGGPAAAAPSTFDYHASGEGPCPLGGTMFADLHLSGSSDASTQQGKLDIEVEAKHHGCHVKAKDTGQLFVLDGAPSIKAEFHMESKPNNVFQLSGGYDGTVDFETDGKSGTCHFDLDFSGSVDQKTGTGTAKLEGKACGVSIRYDAST